MANITLSKREFQRDLLPDVCMFCGEPTETRKVKTFLWHPRLVWLLLALNNLLILLLVAAAVTKKRTVEVPICKRHVGFWSRRLAIVIAILLIVAFLWVRALTYPEILDDKQLGDLLPIFLIVGAMYFMNWLVMAAIYLPFGVRPTEITNRSIQLTGVCESFVAAMNEERAREEKESRKHLRGEYGDEVDERSRWERRGLRNFDDERDPRDWRDDDRPRDYDD